MDAITHGGAEMSETRHLLVAVDGEDLSTDERADLGQQLRDALLEIDLAEIDVAREAQLPPGAKAGETLTFGALAISIAPVAFTQVVGTITAWLRRQRSDIEVEIDGHRLRGAMTAAQRDAIVAAYLARVTEEQS
ncbi:hypothetical protein AB0J72_04770 [Dactylosporangium sp. NPDC049742]|uniref:hypothetical protein n=1 Tax=Dactylosporangium sp. NPDC049742 TaxID=3154737 RepID=UPI00342BD3F5